MNPSKNFCIYRSIVKAAMQRAEKHQWQSGMVNIIVEWKRKLARLVFFFSSAGDRAISQYILTRCLFHQSSFTRSDDDW